MADRGHVAVIGAGVLGLTSALELTKQGFHVTVLARELPGDSDIDYASPRAGAHFRPTPVATEQDAFENTLMHESYDELEALARRDKSAGVEFVPALEYFDSDLAAKDLEMFASWPGFRLLNTSELPSGGAIKAGLTYTAWVLNSPVYLEWLQRQAEAGGAVFAHARLTAVPEAYFQARELRPDITAPHTVVNASGVGFGDAASFPSRGQFILLSNTYDRTVSHHAADGHSAVVIPRPLQGGTVIGGTKEPGNWSHANSPAAIEEILKRVSSVCPDLLQPEPGKPVSSPALHVQEAYIGRRPMRRAGLRLETEELEITQTAANGFGKDTDSIQVVHCYGAGPSGYKISWGAARRVSRMVLEGMPK